MASSNHKTINALSHSYLTHKRMLREEESGIARRPSRYLEPARIIVSHTEEVVDSLKERDRFIIYNEVILGKTGDWYREYLSPATYYRHRKSADQAFIRSIKE